MRQVGFALLGMILAAGETTAQQDPAGWVQQDWLQVCQREPRCRAHLRLGVADLQDLEDEEQRLVVALRTTIALTLLRGPARLPVLCVGVSGAQEEVSLEPRLVAHLRHDAIDAHPSAACEGVEATEEQALPGSPAPRGIWRYRLRSDHSPAWAVHAAVPELKDEAHASFTGSYFGGPLSGKGWCCELQRGAAGWRPVSCHLSWIS